MAKTRSTEKTIPKKKEGTSKKTPTTKNPRSVATLSPKSVTSFTSFTSVASSVAPAKGANGFNIEAFGIKPAASPAKATLKKGFDKDSTLKVSVVKSPNTSAIVFRVQPNDAKSYGSWSEKTFFDHVRNERQWTKDISMDSTVLQWFDGNMPMYNGRGYQIRLFVIYVLELPPKEAIIKLGHHICSQINTDPANNTTMSLHEDTFFWTVDAVWSDLIGCDQALRRLQKEIGQTVPGLYENNKEIIHSYFHPKTFSMELARILQAPIDQVHPEVREDLKGHDDADEDNDADHADDASSSGSDEGIEPSNHDSDYNSKDDNSQDEEHTFDEKV